MKEKESEPSHTPSSLRKEVWIHPVGGKRVHRTTTAVQDSEEEDLASLSSVEVSTHDLTNNLSMEKRVLVPSAKFLIFNLFLKYIPTELLSVGMHFKLEFFQLTQRIK